MAISIFNYNHSSYCFIESIFNNINVPTRYLFLF